MDKKKILIVSKGFYPEITPRSFRATELAKELSRQGHDVTVLTISRDYNYDELHSIYKNLRIKFIDPLVFPAIGTSSDRHMGLLKRGIRRTLLLLFEYPAIELMFMVARALRKESGYDLLISIAVPYPVHWGVAKARNSDHPITKMWIADCGDPYMGCKTDSFNKLFYFAYIEKWFCRKADYITIPLEAARKGYYEEFQNKIRIIPQGISFDQTSISKEIKNEVPTFAYAGGFITGIRDPGKLLNHLASVAKPFKFIIYTNAADMLRPYAEQLKGKLEVRKYIPRKEVLNVLATMDFLVNFDNNTNVQSPSKLIDYALVQRPVLNITADFNPTIIDEFLNGNYNHQLIIPDMTQYNIQNVAGKFLDLLP
ncbi:MAG: glycosyltransferase [Proteobacteria bacterium]|nr:glycosyltransferase [Pseudomonadota bacterium]